MSGATVWITGLPAAGKTTLAMALRGELQAQGVTSYVLDGDVLRRGLNSDLGFSDADRMENVRRVGEVARVLADAGVVALVAVVSPHESSREQARLAHTEAGLPFVEVWLATPLAVCEQRDPKGLYARARRGEVPGMTGVDSPYEPPVHPTLVLEPGRDSVAECVEAVLAHLPGVGSSAAA